MKLTFRWYGPSDPVTLEQISQIPTMSGIVSAVYDVAPGGVWRDESIAAIKSAAAAQAGRHSSGFSGSAAPLSSARSNAARMGRAFPARLFLSRMERIWPVTAVISS